MTVAPIGGERARPLPRSHASSKVMKHVGLQLPPRGVGAGTGRPVGIGEGEGEGLHPVRFTSGLSPTVRSSAGVMPYTRLPTALPLTTVSHCATGVYSVHGPHLSCRQSMCDRVMLAVLYRDNVDSSPPSHCCAALKATP